MSDTVFNLGPQHEVRWSEGAGRMCREASSGSHMGRGTLVPGWGRRKGLQREAGQKEATQS